MGKIAVIFPGQGSQMNNMGLGLYNSNEEYKKIVDLAFAENSSLKDIIFSDDNPLINDTTYSQLAIYSNQIGIYNLIKDKLAGHEVGFAGFSLGEYTALTCAGVMDYELGVQVINSRSIAMASLKDNGTMYAVIGVLKSELIEILKTINEANGTNIEIANSNTEKQQVLAGDAEEFDKVMDQLKETSIRKIVQLKVSGAFHTSRFNDVADSFVGSLESQMFSKPSNEVYLNVTGRKFEGQEFPAYFKEHMVKGVNFFEEVNQMIKDGYDTFIEIGEVSVLAGMVKSIDRSLNIIHIKDEESFEKLGEL